MHILDEGMRGPWFIRDYGMALYNQPDPIRTPPQGNLTISLRSSPTTGRSVRNSTALDGVIGIDSSLHGGAQHGQVQASCGVGLAGAPAR